MPAQDIIKVVLHWSGYGEEGAIGLHFQSAGEHSDSLLNNAAGNIDTMLGTDGSPSTWTNLAALLTQSQRWDEVIVYQYNNLPGKVSNQGRKSVAHIGSNSQTITPLQTCVVAQLLTAESGPRKRGRLYMPGHNFPLSNTTALLSGSATDLVAGTVGSMIGTIGDALSQTLNASDPLDAVVYSPTGGYVTPITSVRVDNRPDIQRRRANKLNPTGASVVTP